MKEEIIELVKKYIGDRSDDETLELLEKIEEVGDDSAEWSEKYDRLDKEWRKRYRDRFFGAKDEAEEKPVCMVDEVDETGIERKLKFEDLYEVKEV